MANTLSHLNAQGEISMVDISAKPESIRVAHAVGKILLAPATMALIDSNQIAKGNVLATARIAGIQAAKQTSQLIPLCHTLLLHHVEVEFAPATDGLEISALVRTIGKTGAEMEALTAVSIAGLTIYDMCKAVDKAMVLDNVRLVSKSKELVSNTSSL